MAGKANQVLAALTALWSAAPAFAGVQVKDGPVVSQDASLEWLFVGYDGGTPGQSRGLAVRQQWLTYGRTMEEAGSVTCAVLVRNGSPDLVAARTRAYSLLAAAETVLRGDMTLGVLVIAAKVSGYDYVPLIGSGGAVARFPFTVDYLAEI